MHKLYSCIVTLFFAFGGQRRLERNLFDVLRRKILHDGQMLINRDGQWWTIHGTYWK